MNDHGSSSSNGQSFEYQYDNNGNMNVDVHKSITETSYNHLNLPIKVSFLTNKRIEWLYSAAGEKLRQTVYNNNQVITTIDYVDGFECEEGAFSFLSMGEYPFGFHVS